MCVCVGVCVCDVYNCIIVLIFIQINSDMTVIQTKARRPQDHIYSVLVPHTSAYSYTYKYHKYYNNLALNKFKEPEFTT